MRASTEEEYCNNDVDGLKGEIHLTFENYTG